MLTVCAVYMLSSCFTCAEVQEMLAVARPLDLTQNIFQDGQWGTLRQARFPEVFWVTQPESPCGLSSAIQHALCMCSFHQQHAFPISSP